MSENRNSIFYMIAVGACLAVFGFAAIGLFLPLVKISGGESITVYSTVGGIIDFFKDIKNTTIDKVVAVAGLLRNTIVVSMALALLIRIIFCFIKYVFKNIRNILHPNDFYGEDVASICIQIAFFSMTMYAYYPDWTYDIGLALMSAAAVFGIVIISLLRIVEGLKSDQKMRGFVHALLMFGAAIVFFVTIQIGMHSPVKVDGGTGRVAIVEEFTNYFTRVFTNFSKDVIVAFILEIVALYLFFDAFKCLGNSCMYSLGCVKKPHKKHVQKEYHFRAILRALMSLAFLAGAIVLVIVKSEEAFGVKYTVGRTGIVSAILIVVGIILIIAAKRVKPKVNTYEKAEQKEENANE